MTYYAGMHVTRGLRRNRDTHPHPSPHILYPCHLSRSTSIPSHPCITSIPCRPCPQKFVFIAIPSPLIQQSVVRIWTQLYWEVYLILAANWLTENIAKSEQTSFDTFKTNLYCCRCTIAMKWSREFSRESA